MYLAVILFIAILALLLYLDTRKPKNYPPGPDWLPLIGSAWTVYRLRKKTGLLHLTTAELAKKYGPILGLKLGQDRIVIVHGMPDNREFLMSDDLSGRPNGFFYKLRTWGERKGVLLTDETFWQEQRRYVLRNLREFGFGRRNMSSMIEEEAAHMVEHLKQRVINNGGSLTINFETFFGVHVLNTLWTMMAGIRYNPDDKILKDLQSNLNKLFIQLDMIGTLFSHFPILRFVAPEYSGYNLYVKTHEPIWRFIRNELRKHKETWDPNNPRDLIDTYLNILNGSDKPESFSELQLLALCLDFFMAGSETTSKSLAFGFLYLLLYPDVQKKAQEEIDRVIGRDRLPSLDDRPKMPYLEGVALESIRMFMGGSFGVPHRALRDTTLNGYFIPKDTMVISNVHSIIRSEFSMYKNPEEFEPERHIKNDRIELSDSYMPFGFGKRRCLGESLAKANIFLFTATLLQHFNLRIPEGEVPPSTSCIDGVTPSPLPYKAYITLREQL